jgi:MarR family transcriptional regulator, organic hydroperoxide resistance regulator
LRDKLVPLAEDVNRIAVRKISTDHIAIARTVLLTIIENMARDEQAADMRMPSTRDLVRVKAAGGRKRR